MKSKINYNFEWDRQKVSENIIKHKVTFERAVELFLDAFAASIF